MAPVDNDNDSGMESQTGSMGSSARDEEGITPETEKPPQTQQPEIEGSYDDEVCITKIVNLSEICSNITSLFSRTKP